MRRVWIEMKVVLQKINETNGHPPCGGCGLKLLHTGWQGQMQPSPSMRRVWIEILTSLRAQKVFLRHPPRGGCGLKFLVGLPMASPSRVTLHAEGVD